MASEREMRSTPGFGFLAGDSYTRSTDSLRAISTAIGGSSSTALQKRVLSPGATELSATVTLPAADGTNRDLLDGTATVATRTPATFDAGWTSPAYAEVTIFVDLRNMLAGDTIIVEFLKVVDSTAAAQVQSTNSYAGAQPEPVKEYTMRCTTTGSFQARARQTAGVARSIFSRAHAFGARLVA